MNARSLFAIGVLAGAAAVSAAVVVRALADTSPNISNVAVAGVTATSTTVTWTTDSNTDSFVNFSQDTNYCGIRNQGPLGTQHSVVIPNLDPGTTYYFRIRSTDANGNQHVSGDYTFTTSSTVDLSTLSSITNPQQQQLSAKALSIIQQITSTQALEAIAGALNQQAKANIGPPNILGVPQLTIGTDNVTVTWNTDQSADGTVFIASAAEYNPSSANPYPRQETDQNGQGKTHTVTIYGLSPSTEYHYMVSSRAGGIGAPGESPDLTFTTKSVLPQIINPHVVTVGEHDVTISWGTPMPSAGEIVYTDMATNKSLSIGDPSYLTTHILQISGLVYQTRYSAVIVAQNQAGDTVKSDPVYFVTTKNLYPPVISQVSNDSTLYPGQDTTVQTVISWATDEPATCFLSYSSGAGADVVTTTAETVPVTKHVEVVTTFSPATVYKYWVTCTDVDGNTTSSEDYVLLTPQQQKSIVDIILQNFQGTFGWLGNFSGGAKK